MHALRKIASQNGAPIPELVNRELRAGLRQLQEPCSDTEPHRCRTNSMGLPAEVKLKKALDVLDQLEEEEITRKMALRK